MKNIRLILIILALLPSLLCMGKSGEGPDTITARRAFMELPSGELDLLSKNTRFDMLAYFDNDSIYKAPNNLRGTSYLEKVTDNYLLVRLSEASTLQLKVLKLKNGNDILMSIYTTGGEGDAQDSDIKFYDAALKPLDSKKYLKAPELKTFFQTKGYKTKMKEIEEILPFYAIYYQASPDNSNLKATLTLGDILTVENQKLIEMFLLPTVTLAWDGKSFKQVKK